MKNKIAWVEKLIQTGGATQEDISKIERWIGYFQHERLVHLIVMAIVAICDFMSIIILLLMPKITAFLIVALLTILFIFYVLHYYILENGVQKLYFLIDKITSIYNEQKRA